MRSVTLKSARVRFCHVNANGTDSIVCRSHSIRVDALISRLYHRRRFSTTDRTLVALGRSLSMTNNVRSLVTACVIAIAGVFLVSSPAVAQPACPPAADTPYTGTLG